MRLLFLNLHSIFRYLHRNRFGGRMFARGFDFRTECLQFRRIGLQLFQLAETGLRFLRHAVGQVKADLFDRFGDGSF